MNPLRSLSRLLSSSLRRRLLVLWHNDSFIRGVTTLSTGIGLAQLLVIGASPILTRLYEPDEMGILSAFGALLSIGLIGGSLRYERAIPIAPIQRIVAIIIMLSSFVLIVNACLLAISLTWWSKFLTNLLDAPLLEQYLWMLPIGILLGGFYELLTFNAVRNEEYALLAKTKLFQGLGLVVTQISLGLMGTGTYGLILGDIAGRFLGIRTLFGSIKKPWECRPRRLLFAHFWSVANRYWQFPLLATPSGILNRSASQAPQLLMLALYDAKSAGVFFLAQNTMAAPLTIIGRSVAKVYLGQISYALRTNSDQLSGILTRTVKRLFIVGFIPIITVICFGPIMFSFIFGADWLEAGFLARYLAIALLFQFSLAPIMQTLIVLERQGILLLFDVFRLALITLAFYLSHAFYLSMEQSVLFYSIALSFSYLCGFVLVKAATKKGPLKKIEKL